jgi:sodium/potassium-transporting ATPase subunit alpha
MVTLTLMSQAYGYIGWTQFWGALFCYYVVANDFGMPPASLQFTANYALTVPLSTDIYNPTAKNLGNSNLSLTSCTNTSEMIDWIYTVHASIDLRMAAVDCKMVSGQAVYSQLISWGTCNVQQISPTTNLPVCYTTEAIKYAQSAYFYGCVICQILNSMVCKTRKLSLFTQGLNNTFMLFSITTEVMLIIAAGYFQPFNSAFGTRDNIFMHFGIPALPFAMLQLIIDEVRKYFIRTLKPNAKTGKPHWFTRAALW